MRTLPLVPLVQIVMQPVERDSPLRMFALDNKGNLWTRLKGPAGWGPWREDKNPDPYERDRA